MSHTSKEPPSQYAAGDLPSNPPEGTVAYDKTNQKMVAFKNSSWGDFGGSGGVGSTTYVRDNVAGVIDQIQGDIPDSWKNSDTSLKGLVIGTSCTSIGSSAFYNCTDITGPLVIPDSVTSIGSFAFYFCSGLTNVDCYVTKTIFDQSLVLGSTGVTTLHAQASDVTWTAGAGQTIGGKTGIEVFKDL